ncbi:MCP four helix bundle domain-containing protein [Paucihalobacter sp.]|uniref:MCP four helix bundle domain-containing protein n=1 Tax=Paucihalobacter sp. TaxID=2850405 RepID=UPI003D161943
MTKKLSTSNRIKIGFSFAIVFILVLATNRFDKKRFETVENSLTSVYEDRLVVKGYIYSLNNIFHNQEKMLLDDTQNYSIDSYHNTVSSLFSSFEATRLTSEEKSTFRNLKDNFEKLQDLELRYVSVEGDTISPSQKERIQVQLKRINRNLDQLAIIQQSEGENMTRFAKSSLNTSSLLSNIEIVLIIIVGIVVQFIIFYK